MNGTGHLAQATAQAMRTGGLLGSTVSVAFALPSSVGDLWHGRRTAGQVGRALVKDAAGGGLAGAAAGASATLAGAVLGGTVIPFVAGAAIAYGVKYAWDAQVQPPPPNPQEAARAALTAAPEEAAPVTA